MQRTCALSDESEGRRERREERGGERRGEERRGEGERGERGEKGASEVSLPEVEHVATLLDGAHAEVAVVLHCDVEEMSERKKKRKENSQQK